MKGLVQVVLWLVVGYAAIAALVYWRQESMVFLPVRALSATPKAIGLSFEDVRLTTEDGVALHGWFVPARSSRATLLFLHGNAGNISHRLESIAVFSRLGLDVLIIDYRGYGQSEGKPTEEGTYRDAMAAWRYLTERRGIDPTGIVIFGRSIGGSVAAWLASRVQPGAVILESSFSSARAVADEYYFWLPTRWLVRLRYDTLAYVKDIRQPVLIVHSAEDEIIGFPHAQRIFAAANPPKQMLVLRGGHNDGFFVSEPDYSGGLARFLNERFPPKR